jgi:hypothetical protein
MDSQPGVDLLALAKQHASEYVGETDTVDQMVERIAHLAKEEPGQARQLVESMAAAVDEATGGAITEQVDGVEQLALHALGLDAQALVAARETAPTGEQDQRTTGPADGD